MREPKDPAGRRTRAFWHHFPADDGLTACTLESFECQGYIPLETCRKLLNGRHGWADESSGLLILASSRSIFLRKLTATSGSPAQRLAVEAITFQVIAISAAFPCLDPLERGV